MDRRKDLIFNKFSSDVTDVLNIDKLYRDMFFEEKKIQFDEKCFNSPANIDVYWSKKQHRMLSKHFKTEADLKIVKFVPHPNAKLKQLRRKLKGYYKFKAERAFRKRVNIEQTSLDIGSIEFFAGMSVLYAFLKDYEKLRSGAIQFSQDIEKGYEKIRKILEEYGKFEEK